MCRIPENKPLSKTTVPVSQVHMHRTEYTCFLHCKS